ncbi:MAG: hypothetical protein ACI9UA_001889 [Pseudoalteromonas tetraodonis]|jgi:hypothetical protein
MNFNELTSEEQEWLDGYLDGTIGREAFDELQDRMLVNPELRAVFRRYVAIDHELHIRSADVDSAASAEVRSWQLAPVHVAPDPKTALRFLLLLPLAAAAAVVFLLGTGFMYLISKPDGGELAAPYLSPKEKSAEGFAVVGRLFDTAWPNGVSGYREGKLLGAEVFRLESGTAEIQFFSGANMTVEGPAEILLTSAWEASCLEGAVRMQVPPAARGFKLQAPNSEIVDLGTEFGLVVRDGQGHVEVFDGEISVQHQDGREILVKQGGAFSLAPDKPMSSQASGTVAFPDARSLDSRSGERLRSDFARWLLHRDELSKDGRLLAYYTFGQGDATALIPNLSLPRNPELDGAIILAEPVAGRWRGLKSALEFHRPGSRVRVNLPGEFPALSFACWARIDSLDRQYSALFMGDGYETGESHWQIREDGKMMLSVMIDDSARHPKYPKKSRYHHVYFSPPMWDLSMSGEWLHLASVFDPVTATVCHYVNGERISREKIEPDFQIDTLRIGNAEIGNWGQPFREDPSFAIRNLNGRMDEIAIFKAALNDAEVEKLFDRSRSRHR